MTLQANEFAGSKCDASESFHAVGFTFLVRRRSVYTISAIVVLCCPLTADRALPLTTPPLTALDGRRADLASLPASSASANSRIVRESDMRRRGWRLGDRDDLMISVNYVGRGATSASKRAYKNRHQNGTKKSKMPDHTSYRRL